MFLQNSEIGFSEGNVGYGLQQTVFRTKEVGRENWVIKAKSTLVFAARTVESSSVTASRSLGIAVYELVRKLLITN